MWSVKVSCSVTRDARLNRALRGGGLLQSFEQNSGLRGFWAEFQF